MHAFDFAAQLAILLFEDQNACDAGKIDAFVLAQALSASQAGNVTQAIAASAAIRALRTNQTEAVVLTEGLGVNVGQLGGLADGEDGQFDVEADVIGSVEIGPAHHERGCAHRVQLLHLVG